MDNLEMEQKFVKGMSTLVKTCQVSAVLIFASIYYLDLGAVFIKEQIVLCALCIIAQLLINAAENKLDKKIQEQTKENETMK